MRKKTTVTTTLKYMYLRTSNDNGSEVVQLSFDPNSGYVLTVAGTCDSWIKWISDEKTQVNTSVDIVNIEYTRSKTSILCT